MSSKVAPTSSAGVESTPLMGANPRIFLTGSSDTVPTEPVVQVPEESTDTPAVAPTEPVVQQVPEESTDGPMPAVAPSLGAPDVQVPEGSTDGPMPAVAP